MDIDEGPGGPQGPARPPAVPGSDGDDGVAPADDPGTGDTGTGDTGTGDTGERPPTASPQGSGAGRAFLRDRLPTWLFVAFVAVAGPLILFHLGSYHWFLRDDFVFLAERQGFPDLLEPHGGSHWVALPRMIYFVLWQVVGMTSYVPYQACVVAYHLAVAVLLRVVMRRAGVGPWLASAAAGIMVLFGPGFENIVWAFQVSFTGALAWGLVHLLLADHDGRLGRRDALGLAAGLLGLASSAVGVTMVAVVGLAVLLRRGWRMALVHTVPLAAVYGIWTATSDAETTSPLGRPSAAQLLRWVRSAEVGTFTAIGHFQVVAAALVVLLVVGLAVALGPGREGSWADARARLSMPVALLAGSILFATTTGLGRWWAGGDAPRASRYLYLGAALTLPILAVAAQALARRWRPLTPVLVALFLLPIPFNVADFEPRAFGPRYMEGRERILTTAPAVPFAGRVPGDVQPLVDPYASDALTIGFLRTAVRNGDLTPSSGPLTDRERNEFRVRLGVAARPPAPGTGAGDCTFVTEPLPLSPEEGDVFLIRRPVDISTRAGDRRSSPVVSFPGSPYSELTIELPDLHLLITPAAGAGAFTICTPG